MPIFFYGRLTNDHRCQSILFSELIILSYLFTNFNVNPSPAVNETGRDCIGYQFELWQSIKNVKFIDRRTENRERRKKNHAQTTKSFVYSLWLRHTRYIFLAPTWESIYMQIENKAAARPSQDKLDCWLPVIMRFARRLPTTSHAHSIKSDDVSAGQLNFRMTRIGGITSHHCTSAIRLPSYETNMNESHKYTWRSRSSVIEAI